MDDKTRIAQLELENAQLRDQLHRPEMFNPQMLTLARHLRGLSQKELANKVKLHQGNISKYENGIVIPSDDHIKRLADSLGFPEGFFYRKGEIHPGLCYKHKL